VPQTRIACHQLAPVVGDLEGNRARALDAIDAAAAAGAHVLVLPELATSGYVFRDAEEARSLAEPADGPSLAQWAERAARHGMVIAAGFAEAGDDGRLYNSAALVDPTGVRAVYRKAHLWDAEPDFFTPGDAPAPVVDTEHGRIALMVCYDLEFPEWVRGVALRGAELLCVPTNWPFEPRPDGERPMEVVHVMSHASTNRLVVAACDRCGTERGVEWTAGTAIAGTRGWLLARVPGDAPALIHADVDLATARDKALGPRNDALADRRPALYVE
jgi:predicted amidohydrolase